jgi:hypothetical protein
LHVVQSYQIAAMQQQQGHRLKNSTLTCPKPQKIHGGGGSEKL